MTISAPSCERMMSSIPWRSSVPGATRAIDANRRGSRRGSCSDGERVKPRVPGSLSVLSGIEPRLDRVSERVVLLDFEFAMRGGAPRGDDAIEAELCALVQPALGLGGRAQAAGEPDLAEGREAGPHRRRLGSRGNGQRDREVRARLVDAYAPRDVHEHVRAA